MAIVEIAVAMFNSANPIGARVGSIVVARRPLGEMGTKERALYIWLQVQGPAEAALLALSSPRYVDPETELVMTDKFRWEFPIEELAKETPDFDTMRALSPTDPYQPFLNLDERRGRFNPKGPPVFATPVRERGA